MSVLWSCVPALVSLFGLFPVLVKCDYKLIISLLCLIMLLLPVYLSFCLFS